MVRGGATTLGVSIHHVNQRPGVIHETSPIHIFDRSVSVSTPSKRHQVIYEGTKTSGPLSRRVGDQGRDGQSHLCAHSPSAPEVQPAADSFGPFANARQAPVAITPACLEN